MNEILNQYKVSFSIKTFFNQNFKSMHTINDMLTVYIMDHNTPLQANLLINEINEVLQETKIIRRVGYSKFIFLSYNTK